jgi:hypothetical protein
MLQELGSMTTKPLSEKTKYEIKWRLKPNITKTCLFGFSIENVNTWNDQLEIKFVKYISGTN